jgi:hypothetical protein
MSVFAVAMPVDWLDARNGGYRKPEGFDVMQVCMSGPMISAYVKTMPEFSKPFCPSCGAKTINACPKCSASIQGDFINSGAIGLGPTGPSKYCHQCGEAYPWTSAKLLATQELISDLDQLSVEERARLAGAVLDLATDNPRTELGVSRFKKLALKAGQTVGGSLYKMVVDISSEAAKRALLG